MSAATPSIRRDLLRAVAELARARTALDKLRAPDLIAMDHADYSGVSSVWIDRVAYAIPRVAAWVPWRADCLVQALAARRWLGSKGVPSSLRMGVQTQDGAFRAHAWLVVADTVVTGRPIDGYVALDLAKQGSGEATHFLLSGANGR